MKNAAVNLRDLVILVADPNSYARRIINGMLRGFGANKILEVENSTGLFQSLTGQKIDDDHTRSQLSEVSAPPPVPSTAIYSRADGVVAWQNCCEEVGPTSDNIEVYGSHCGLGINASVLYAVADRLAQAEDDWHPFERTGLRALVYPSAGHA